MVSESKISLKMKKLYFKVIELVGNYLNVPSCRNNNKCFKFQKNK